MIRFRFTCALGLSLLMATLFACGQPNSSNGVSSSKQLSQLESVDTELLTNEPFEFDPDLSGACSDHLAAVLRQPLNEYYITDCPRKAWGAKEGTERCLKENIPAFNHPASQGCLGCISQTAQCAAASCKLACMWGSCTSGCLGCVESKCGNQSRSCTGQPTDRMPKCRSARP